MRRKKLSPATAPVIAVPLPPDRDLGGTYRPELSGVDMRDLTDLAFKALTAARKSLAEAPTPRQRAARQERVEHWWRLYQRLLP